MCAKYVLIMHYTCIEYGGLFLIGLELEYPLVTNWIGT